MKRNYIKLLLLVSIIFFTARGEMFCQKNNKWKDVSVLYVGYSPDNELPPNSLRAGGGLSDERYEEDMRSRMGEFKKLLTRYFNNVVTIDARDYKESISAEYDVTIFDGLPDPISPRIFEKDPETGKTIRYEPAKYLSDDFSYAAIFLAQFAPTLGEPIGTKTDWYCMCLYSYAFETNTDHPVFNEPLKVGIKMKKVKTPPELFNYPTGKDLPEEIPMWRVQTESSKDGKGYRSGVVAHGRPFMEAPDCEYISGGQCMKEITAAAIARHGNFMHWGFAASPGYMTKAAKKTFVNAVYYMSKFKNRTPLLRANENAPRPRSWIDYKIYTFSRQKYEIDAENTRNFVRMLLQDQKRAREKKERGEELTSSEKYAVDFKPYEPATWEKYIEDKKNTPLVKSLGGSIQKTVEFLEENRPYFTGASPVEKSSFDSDARSLGIPNNDHRILDAAISLLEEGKDETRAKRILERYTVKSFNYVSEWREWYDNVKDYLFFAEASGYKFFVDSYNNPELYAEEIIGLENMIVPEPDEMNPVTSSLEILPAIDGYNAIVIKVKIMEDHYVYATASSDIPFVLFSADIDLPEGLVPFGEMRYPQPEPYEGNPAIGVYRGELVIMQKLVGESKEKISCTLNYQYCNDEHCSLPIERTLTTNNRCIFNLSVKYNQPADDSLFFSYRDVDGKEIKTIIPIKNGKGSFSAETCHPYWGRYNSGKYPANGGILLDGGDISLKLDTASYGSEVKGSSLNDEYTGRYRSFRQDLNNESRKYINNYINLREEGIVTKDSLNYLYSEYYRYKRMRVKEYIKAYPESYYSLILARNMFHSSVDYKEIKEVYELLQPVMQQTVIGRQLYGKVQAAKATMIGNTAPEIVLNDFEGKMHKLSDYRGQYVFLDFYKWGCPPCEDLMEELKPFYAEYKGKDFVILGVYHRTNNDLYKSRERWKGLLEKHSPTWTNLFDNDNKACEDYGIEAFPSSLLIDRDGKIISYEPGIKELVDYIEENK